MSNVKNLQRVRESLKRAHAISPAVVRNWLVGFVVLGALQCDRRAPSRVEPGPTPQPVGECHDVEVSGVCTFDRVDEIDPELGYAVPDAAPGPDGMVVFRVGYSAPDGGGYPVSIRVRAKPSERAALERFYASHREASCGGVIVNPPCPPGVHVAVQVRAPPVGTVLRRGTVRRALRPFTEYPPAHRDMCRMLIGMRAR
ncbi:MAG: hypothetical protein QOI41_1931 [Myxococcales bacterium]|nr:hypothetical protein [Myxococcales bacterium]